MVFGLARGFRPLPCLVLLVCPVEQVAFESFDLAGFDALSNHRPELRQWSRLEGQCRPVAPGQVERPPDTLPAGESTHLDEGRPGQDCRPVANPFNGVGILARLLEQGESDVRLARADVVFGPVGVSKVVDCSASLDVAGLVVHSALACGVAVRPAGKVDNAVAALIHNTGANSPNIQQVAHKPLASLRSDAILASGGALRPLGVFTLLKLLERFGAGLDGK